MKKLSEITQALPFYLFVAGVYLIIVFKDLFSNGMFLDGLIYSTVSKNLADGLGTFWNPHFTVTCIPEFHEHPPLAFGIQSLFFRLLGESRYIDKLYSLLTVIITGYIILKIWKVLGYKHGWFPLFIWIITPTVFWASYNNLLENTLTIFTSLSILYYLKNQKSTNYFFIFLSGFMLTLGFLTKGFVAFFPWTFPFLLWLFLRQKTFGKAILDSAGLVMSTLAPLIILIFLFPVAHLSLQKYINGQVINSVRNVITVSSRFDILERLFDELLPAAGLCILLLIWARIRKLPSVILKKNSMLTLVFVSLGLTGVLPIMISMKQSGFYIVATYPFFAIGAGIFVYPVIEFLLTKLNFESKGFQVFRLIGCGLFLTGIILSVYSSGQFSRDKVKIKDTYSILTQIPQGTIININPHMYDDWSLHGYFGRFKNVSLDPDLKNNRDYLLIRNEDYSDTLNSNYKIVKINTIYYQLFKRK